MTDGIYVHALGVANDGLLWHTSEWRAGKAPFGDVEGPAGRRGPFVDASAANLYETLHACVVARDGGLWHTIRFEEGGWLSFGDVISATRSNPGQFARVGIENIDSDLHVCGVAGNLRAVHAIRMGNGDWTPFGDIGSNAGTPDEQFVDIGCAGIYRTLHVCAATQTGELLHAIRFAEGHWQQFGDVKGPAGNPGEVVAVDCAASDTTLIVCAVTRNGGLWRATRDASGGWSQFVPVNEGHRPDPGPVKDVSCTESDIWFVTRTGELYSAWPRFEDQIKPRGGSMRFDTVGITRFRVRIN